MRVWHSRCFTGIPFSSINPDQRYVAVRTCVWLPQGDSGPHHDCGL
nr:MAG TPA: hypothetical protein [Caudoviricetes sp.]